MPSVVHFEICADDAPRAMKFYEETFGWTFRKYPGTENDDEYYLIDTHKESVGINGGMFLRGELMTGNIHTIDVPDIDEYAAKVVAGGGEIVTDKSHIPNVGYLIYCKDTEGSVFGIIEYVKKETK